MSVNDDVELMRQVPLFADVNPAHLQAMLFTAERVDIAADKLLLRAGNKNSSAYLVIQGKGDVYEGTGKKTKLIAKVERGAFIGELSMIAHSPHSVSVRAVTPLLAVRVSNELFMRVCNEFPEVGARVLARLSAKLDLSLENLRDVQGYFDSAKSFSRS